MAEKVFVLTRGSYSDYHIESIWSTREAAEKAANIRGLGDRDPWYSFNDEDWDVVEWEINSIVPKSRVLWKASVEHNGDITVEDRPYEFAEGSEVDDPYVRFSGTYRNNYFWGEAYGQSPEHARKILADKLAEFKANDAEYKRFIELEEAFRENARKKREFMKASGEVVQLSSYRSTTSPYEAEYIVHYSDGSQMNLSAAEFNQILAEELKTND